MFPRNFGKHLLDYMFNISEVNIFDNNVVYTTTKGKFSLEFSTGSTLTVM
jgi:hypothetical protein